MVDKSYSNNTPGIITAQVEINVEGFQAFPQYVFGGCLHKRFGNAVAGMLPMVILFYLFA